MKIIQRLPPPGPTTRDPYAGGAVVRLTRLEWICVRTSPRMFPQEQEPIEVLATRPGKIPAGVYDGSGSNW